MMAEETVAVEPMPEEPRGLTKDEQAFFDGRVAALISPYKCSIGPKEAYDDERNIYVEFRASPGPLSEMRNTIFLTIESAVESWERQMREYLVGKTKIVWRIPPEADCSRHFYAREWSTWDKPGLPPLRSFRDFVVYARLFAE